MSIPAYPTIEQVRTVLRLEVASHSQYSNDTIGSNIGAAARMLERKTSRILWNRTGFTWRTTTHGAPHVTIPGLRTATSVTSSGTTLTADSTYHLIPDANQSGLFTGVAVRGFNQYGSGPWWLHYSEWFDRNFDSPFRPGGGTTSVPNDLVIVGDWGFASGSEPEDLLVANKLLAAHLTIYPSALLGGGSATEAGSLNDLSGFPEFVLQFIRDWNIGAVGVAQA